MPAQRLELGAGHRPTPGYLHNDVNQFPGIELVGPAWEVDRPDGSLDEVLALGVIEHLAYEQVDATFRNVHRMLKPSGLFLFDVPDLPVWCEYLIDHHHGKATPFSAEHILATLYGWQRWPGDEHKSGWSERTIVAAITAAGFSGVRFNLEPFKHRADRRRFERATDAHLYVVADR